jgi:Mrp family chromosome partitioning ATPase
MSPPLRLGPARLAVGLGSPAAEAALLPLLAAADDLEVAARCLGAEDLLAAAREPAIDAVLVGLDLHRLSPELLAELASGRWSLVVLAPLGAPPDLPGLVVPAEAEPAEVLQALRLAVGGPPAPAAAVARGPGSRDEPPPGPAPEADGTVVSGLVAVAGPPGAPGRTTVALGVAAGLGTIAPTVLVEADATAPSVAAYLDLDPSRNAFMLAHAEPATPRDWEEILAQELQPLDRARSPHAVVLCGVPKPEMRAALRPAFVARLLEELGRRYRYVVVDLGPDPLGAERSVGVPTLDRAEAILVVVAAELVGLHRARGLLGPLRARPAPERLALVVNRHDPKRHHAWQEIEWALGAPAGAVIPYDWGAVQRAAAAQRPVVFEGRGPAAQALLELAGRIYGRRLRLPPDPERPGRWAWASRRAGWLRRSPATAPVREGVADGR